MWWGVVCGAVRTHLDGIRNHASRVKTGTQGLVVVVVV